MAEAAENLNLGLVTATKQPKELKPIRKKEQRTILFTSAQITEDPSKNQDNPRIALPNGTVVRNMPFKPGSDPVDTLSGELVFFATKPVKNEETNTWNWSVFYTRGDERKYGWVSTRNRRRGTVFMRHQGKDRIGTVSGKPRYPKYQKSVAFIQEDLVY